MPIVGVVMAGTSLSVSRYVKAVEKTYSSHAGCHVNSRDRLKTKFKTHRHLFCAAVSQEMQQKPRLTFAHSHYYVAPVTF